MAAPSTIPNGSPTPSAVPSHHAGDGAEDDLGFNIDIRRLLIQGRWWILIPAAVVTVATALVVQALPKRYTSEATLVVVQQQVPERYVTPNSTTPVAVELQAMKQEVLSRTRLQEIIKTFGLYAKEVNESAPEKVILNMQKDIDITPVSEMATPAGRDFNAFKISFTGAQPVLAQQVTSTLTSLFIKENLRSRGDQAANTTAFLNDQLKSAKEKLEEQDQRLRDFKMQHLGELPEQQQGNLGILTSLQAQLQTTMASMSRAREQRVYLETLLSGYQSMRSRNIPIQVTSTGVEVSREANPGDVAQAVVVRLQAERAALLSRYTATHPDVLSKDSEIASAKAAVARLEKEEKVKAAPAASPKPSTVAPTAGHDPYDQPLIAQTKSQLEANRVEMENLAKDEARLKAALEQYQQRLNQTPVREQQLSGIQRDYELQKQNYTDLLNKKLQSQLATNLEKDQGGRQFRLVDPPSLPTIPSSPNRRKIALGGVAAGIGLGVALAALMGFKDRSFYSEKAITKRFGLSLVVGVPVLLTLSERRARVRRMSFEWVAGSLLMLVVLAAEAYVLRQH
jgi:polysaccharide chain length determinant protein (PEP-CTERM system associated)